MEFLVLWLSVLIFHQPSEERVVGGGSSVAQSEREGLMGEARSFSFIFKQLLLVCALLLIATLAYIDVGVRE